MFALLLTGPPGSGKSSVLTELHDGLGDAGIANALIELDELERSYPPLDTARVLRHLALLAGSYREAGHTLLLVTATIEDDAYGEALSAAIGADAQLTVRLDAEPDTVRHRVLDREPETWSGREELAKHAHRLATRMRHLSCVDLVLSNEGTGPADAAALLEVALREHPAAPPIGVDQIAD